MNALRPRADLDLSLYLVLDPELCGGAAGMVDTAQIAAQNGASVVQLRAPNWKKRQWYDCALELKRVLKPFGVPLIINDQVDVALAVDADGVHVGQSDLPVEAVRRLIGPHKWLGLSVSDAAELAAVPANGVDHLGIGPVFATPTKGDAAPATGLPLLAELCAASRLPVVAIGGIGLANCASVLQCGADGIAVVSAICGQADVAASTRALRGVVDTALQRGVPAP